MKQTLTQLIRYGIVGLAFNAFGYLLYLVLTRLGMGPKFAMSLLYGSTSFEDFPLGQVMSIIKWVFINWPFHRKCWACACIDMLAPGLRSY